MEKAIKEKRLLDISAVDSDSDKMVIEGYAVVFEQEATHDFTEVVDRHAFDNCDFSDCVLRYNHLESQHSMARTRNHSLELIVDDHGLKIRANLIDTQQNRDVYKMVKEKLVDKMSFAFTVIKEAWNNDTKTRRILAIDKLYDVSVVDLPWYEGTEVFARSLQDYQNDYAEKRKLEFEKEKMKMLLSL